MTTLAVSGGCRRARSYNVFVWRRFRVLNRIQVFVVAWLSAIPIAVSVALASMPPEGTSMQRFLAPSHEYDPLINGAVAFVSVLLVLLCYYRLGGVGTLLGCLTSAVAWLALRVAALFVFAFAIVGHSPVLQEVVFVIVCLTLSVLILVLHLRSNRDAQTFINTS